MKLEETQGQVVAAATTPLHRSHVLLLMYVTGDLGGYCEIYSLTREGSEKTQRSQKTRVRSGMGSPMHYPAFNARVRKSWS